ncbi:MAG TPA: Fic family protein [Acidimicrobiales bacterium]|nr:Fic family protein [Acidimicrobiales bacterium]
MTKPNHRTSMLGKYESKTWQSDPTLVAPARYKKACQYETFIPMPIAELEITVSGRVQAIISEAEAAIKELNSQSESVLDPFSRLLLRTESIASSKVEGLQADTRVLARAQVAVETGRRTSRTALEILGNIAAMQEAIQHATSGASVEVEHLIEIHRQLMATASNSEVAGRIRTEQNWIGGNNYNPCGADFVPPPPEYLELLLGDLCRFSGYENLSPIVQAAIGHAQFETIHPFVDGNGRTGRALIHILLRRRGLATSYVPPISVILASNKDLYIDGLTAYRNGDLQYWLEIFAVAAARAAGLAQTYLQEVKSLQEVWRDRLRASSKVRSDAAAWKLIDYMPAQPIVTLATAVQSINRTKPAVNGAIDQLVLAGVLKPLSQGRRNREWEADGLISIISDLESGGRVDHHIDSPSRNSDASSSKHEADFSNDQLVRLPFTDQIFRLGPASWLLSAGEPPEYSIRLVVAAPAVQPFGAVRSGMPVTLFRGEDREDLIREVLDASSLTNWLNSSLGLGTNRRIAQWIPVGSGNADLTELWFAPYGLDSQRPKIWARCAFLTGTVLDDELRERPSIQAAFDVALNLRDFDVIDDDDEDSIVRKREHNPEAALTLGEVNSQLIRMFEFVEVTKRISGRLLPDPQPLKATIGLWLTPPTGQKESLINLTRHSKIPRSMGLSQTVIGFDAPFANDDRLSERQIKEVSLELIHEMLERGGYRDLKKLPEELYT